MDSTQCEEFMKYLIKFGVTSKSDVIFEKQSKKKSSFSEKQTIAKVKDYLFSSFANGNKLSNICSNLYERYIDYDDECVTKLIKRLLVIYTQSHKKCLNSYVLKWKIKAVKLSFSFHDNKTKAYIKKKINNVPTNHSLNSSINDKAAQDVSHSQSFQIQIANEANFSITDRQERNKAKIKRNNKEATFLRHSHQRSLNNISHNNRRKQIEAPKTPEHHKVKLTLKEKEELFCSLYNDSKNRKEKLKKMILEKEHCFNSQYTFTPQLATRARSSDKYRYRNDTSFIDRLQTYNQSRKSNLKKIEQEVIESLPKPKQCKRPIEPHLISKSEDYKQMKQDSIRKIENTMRQEQGITFKPMLNDTINAMISDSVIERNERFLKQKLEKLSIQRGDKECSFKPTINETSSTATKGTQEEDCSQIGKRLYEYQSKYLQNLEEKKEQYKQSYPFKPSISKNTDEILENKRKIMEELKRRYENRLQNENGNEKAWRKDTEDNQVNYKLKTLNDFTDNDNSSSAKDENNDMPKAETIKDKVDIKPSSFEEKVQAISTSTVKNESTYKNTKITSSVENLTDDKLLELARNYISIDESLEKFQLRYKSKQGTNENKISNQQSIVYKDQDNDKNHNTQQSSSSNKAPKALMKNLNYYDNLC